MRGRSSGSTAESSLYANIIIGVERQPCNHKGIEEGAHIIHTDDCNELGDFPVVNTNNTAGEVVSEQPSTPESKPREPISTGT